MSSTEIGTTRVLRVRHGSAQQRCEDSVAVEAPLRLCRDGVEVASLLRSPGDDVDLALGHLFCRGELASLDEVASIVRLGRGETSTVDVRLDRARPAQAPVEAPDRAPLDANLVVWSVGRLPELQPCFLRTGSLHAAAAFDRDGHLLACREDVGRHNAVDKVVGVLLRERRLGAGARHPGPAVLAVSGRAGCDILEKACAAAVPVVASVSAPTSRAVELAERAGITLAGFVRGEGFNLYAHPWRILLGSSPEGR